MKVLSRLFPVLFFLSVAISSRADIGLEPIPDQTLPSGKTLVVPLVATDPGGPARSYTVRLGPATYNGNSTSAAGLTAAIRTGDPHLLVGVSYTDSNSVAQTGTMEFQLLREFAPLTTQIIAGLAQGGYYNPKASLSGTTYVPFHRVFSGFVIQGGDPSGTGTGGPGFTFPNEFNNALIFSGSSGQLAMANAGYSGDNSNGTNGSQFFITLAPERSLDFGYNLFGQLLRGTDTLFGIAGTPVQFDITSGEDSSPVNPVNITSAAVTQNDTDAVLLLSATGVCDQTVTVTVSSSNGAAEQVFTAHAVADSTDDRPFLQPVLDIAGQNRTTKVVLQGIDLQRDLLRYGYQHLEPWTDNSITWSASPKLDIPIATSTDNIIAAALANWNESNVPDGNSTAANTIDFRVFQIAPGDKPLRGALADIGPGTFGSLNLQSFPVATFIAGNSKDTAGAFTATVNWGDGGLASGTNVTILKVGRGSLNKYSLIASHSYANPGEYPLLVNIADSNGANLALTGTVNITSSALAISGNDLYRAGGVFKNQIVAGFTDAGGADTAAGYTAAIDWGDGAVSQGAVKQKGRRYQVLGTHTYTSPHIYTVSVTVQRQGDSSYSACEWLTAHISGINKAPAVFPPFNQAHLAQAWSPLTGGVLSIVVSGSGGPVDESQLYISGTATIVNSGNEPSRPGSLTVYIDPEPDLDESAVSCAVGGTNAISIPALKPGEDYIIPFEQETHSDNRLKLPPEYDPTGQYILGAVTYSDPVGDYNGTQKVIMIGHY
ncbi:MAG TPA: peptidylprolyl isomerase [Chthoniobacteraceae bacterium]|jgi:cyclophilin family peptidyl-prolyl cis-trans isomerase|nr:peptidylprolyl isomerase [Chthoniobacteraceae bacterium]